MKDTFNFERTFDGQAMPESLGRLHLASGNGVRIFFTDKGMKFAISEKSKDNGDIIWWSPNNQLLGIEGL